MMADKNKKYEICMVPTYKTTYERSKKITSSLSIIKDALECDGQFHERLHKDDNLKLAIDLDKIKKNNRHASYENICKDICEYIPEINMTDISYTTNKSILDGSHHIVIPKYYMKSEDQKIFWAEFVKKYNYGKEIDYGIFGKDGWFRLPNQTKEGEVGTAHIIQHGNLEDFVLKYIPDECVEYKRDEEIVDEETTDDTKSIATTLTTSTIDNIKPPSTSSVVVVKEDDFHKVDYYIMNGFDDANYTFEQMTSIGLALNHEFKENGLSLFLNIARKYSDNYDEKEYTNRYNRLIPTKEGKNGKKIGIASIFYIFQQTDKDLYKKVSKNYKDILNTKKKTDTHKAHVEQGIEYVSDDNDCAEKLLTELKELLFYCKGSLFLKINHIWTNDKQCIDLTLLNMILKKSWYSVNDKGDIKPYSQYVKNAKNIREALLSKVMTENKRDENYNKFHTTTKGRLCFLDGVLDFIQKDFYTWERVDFEYYTTIQINRNFKTYFDNPNREEITSIKEKIYDVAFGEKVNDALHFLSRGIAGHCEDKNFSVYIGNRNCGKGVIYEGLKCAFEYYVKPFELSMVQYQRETNSDEVSRKMYWLLDLEFARLALSQEIPAVEKNMKTCSKTFKKLTGGGDEHIARRNYDRVDTHFKIDSTFLIMGNNEMLADKQDLFEHCIEFHSVIQFKTQEEIDKMKADNEDEKIIQIHKVKDETIKEKCHTEAWKNAMIYLLYENYKDKPVSTFKKIDTYDEDEQPLRKRILENFDITGNMEDYITSADIHEILHDSKQKVKIELESLNVIRKQQTKGEDRKKQCYFGLRKKHNTEETHY